MSGFIEILGVIILFVAIAVAISVLWCYAVWWSLTYFHLITMPFSWEFVVAFSVLSWLVGGTLRLVFNRRRRW